MRVWDLPGFKRCSACLVLAGIVWINPASGQDLLPSFQFASESGDWTSASSWALRGTDPPETGVPGEAEIAAILNGGTANLGSAADDVLGLSVRSGMLGLNDGGSLSVAGQAIVGSGGSLHLGGGTLAANSFSMLGGIDLPADADLSFGNAWPVVTSDNAQGTPNAITVGGAAANLPLGLSLQYVPTDNGTAVTVGSEPILVVDRATGGVQIKNMAGGPIDVKGYSIGSESGRLKRTGARPRWESLEDQDAEGWVEANPARDNTLFSEFNLDGASTVGVGESLDLGFPFVNGVGLPPRDEDLTFDYILGDGRVFENAKVMYEGPVNDLVLTVNPDTGEASLSNASGQVAFDIASYTILSASGQLIVDNFSGIGGDWVNANPQTTALAELNLTGSQVFGENSSLDLGAIFTPGGEQDLEFFFSTAANSVSPGTIVYGEADPPIVFLPADFDESGSVDFPDFLLLSSAFGTTVDPAGTDPDINGDGEVNFPDFLELSATFGQSAPAASVPEPATGLLMFLGFLGMLQLRRRNTRVAVAVAATCIASASIAQAEDFDVRFIRLHPDGPNANVNNSVEARDIVRGRAIDALINEDITDTIEIIDFAGGPGTFLDFESPYPNGVDNDSMEDFVVYVSGVLEIPEGTWTIGCGSDDGCLLNLPGVEFDEAYGENGPADLRIDDDGEIIYNGTRGHGWTIGTFTTRNAITTGFESLAFERGGGDSFEVAILEGEPLGDTDAEKIADFTQVAFELTDGESGWSVTGAPFMLGMPGDFDGNGVIDEEDAEEIEKNFGEAGAYEDGDINGDGFVDFHDLSEFLPHYQAAQPAGAQTVPEPSSMITGLLGLLALFGVRRRQR